MKPCYVYKHFDADGEVIYVGQSCNPMVRTARHQGSAEWFPQVRNIEIMSFASKGEACRVEAELIKDLKPRFNVEHLLPRGLQAIENRRAELGTNHMRLRALLIPEIKAIGMKRLAELIGVAESTIVRFAYLDTVPFFCTVATVDKYFEQKEKENPD